MHVLHKIASAPQRDSRIQVLHVNHGSRVSVPVLEALASFHSNSRLTELNYMNFGSRLAEALQQYLESESATI